ncbi:hypothetical protein RvY_09082 [Ramazzottius varieornatus]|uniref:Phosphatidylserine synthase n=1 Tax=Ramazzottius varieornatus TaxID=947166 RepID=A0A1D1VG23_RAMVA|nr:hypothetical protein RvY_09082 [Ramazzottius varieornatus]
MLSRRDEIERSGREGTFAVTSPDIEVRTAHDWEYYKGTRKCRLVLDDGTITFFWRAHTLTVLFFITCALAYVTFFEPISYDTSFNTRRGILAVMVMFLVFGIMTTSDGPFRRPHPIVWRFVFNISVLYELCLIFLLLQSPDDARRLLKHIDPTLGVELPEKDYGGSCLIYDRNHTDPYHNVWDKFDGFVPTHFFGWWLKTLILRDWWLCTVISIMFELLEYTLEHQLPNFSECWWDHWIMDALICNGTGIVLGMITLKYLEIRPYHWRGLWTIQTYSGKLKRMVAQFTPYSWVEFDWRPLSSFKRWAAMMGVICIFLMAELNTFYLKYVLWIPPPNSMNLIRLIFFLLCGGVAMRETFEYLDNPKCKKLGKQAWMVLIVIITELLIVMRFDLELITKPLPSMIALLWLTFGTLCIMWTIWQFGYRGKIRWGFGGQPLHSQDSGVSLEPEYPQNSSDSSLDWGTAVTFSIKDFVDKKDE